MSSDLPIDRSGIGAVLVSYQPGPETAAHLAAIAAQVDRVLIVDNGSRRELLELIESAARNVGAEIERLPGNFGIARALNIALEWARRRGYRWLATFDQDSSPASGMLASMSEVLMGYEARSKVALVAPVHVDRSCGVEVRHRAAGGAAADWRLICTTMSSGSLLNVAAAQAVGDFDESLFIDYVDHEFCLRLRRAGYQILEATQARLSHSLGRMQVRRLLSRTIAFTNHAPARRYYMSRNRIIVWRRYWGAEKRWILRDLRSFCSESAYVVLFERHSGLKLWMTLRGIYDALRGVRGALDAHPESEPHPRRS